MENKIKYCKCGHVLKPYHENKGKLFGITYNKNTKCNGKVSVENVSVDCCCEYFVNRNRPDKSDKIMIVILVGSLTLMIGVLFSGVYLAELVITCADKICIESVNKPQFTLKDLSPLFIGILLILGIYLINILLSQIVDYRQLKQRPNKPLQS